MEGNHSSDETCCCWGGGMTQANLFPTLHNLLRNFSSCSSSSSGGAEPSEGAVAELTLCTVCTVVSNDSYLHERRIGGSALMSRLLVRRLAACYQAFATATATM